MAETSKPAPSGAAAGTALHHQAAVLIVLRANPQSGAPLEVLACQNEVYNYLRNHRRPLGLGRITGEQYLDRSGQLRFPETIVNRWPGEWRFPGGRQHAEDPSPVSTCLRKLREIIPDLRVPPESEIKFTLLRKTVVRGRLGGGGGGGGGAGSSPNEASAGGIASSTPAGTTSAAPLAHPAAVDKVFHVYTFVAFVHENPWLDEFDPETVNRRLQRRREKYFRSLQKQDEALSASVQQQIAGHDSPAARSRHRQALRLRETQPPALVIHQVSWMPIRELLEIQAADRPAVNAWQWLELQKFCVARRQIEPETERLLQDILATGTPEALVQKSLEASIRSIASAKSLSERAVQQALFRSHGLDDSVELFDLTTMRLLSMNLNVLPPGVGLVASEAMAGNSDRRERIDDFVAQVEARGRAGRPLDVLALQEVFASPFGLKQFCSQTYLRRRLARIGFVHYCVAQPPNFRQTLCQGKWTDAGLLIVSKHPIEASRSLVFRSPARHMDAGALKGVLFAQIRFGRRSLLIFNTHLQASHGAEPDWRRIRRRQLLELRQFVLAVVRDCRAGEGGGGSPPYVVCGDFNVDAIPSDARDAFFGGGFFDFDSAADDSDEYLDMCGILSPDGSMLDLLKARYGRHPSTRPPRRSFPRRVEYIAHHKWPQRLDYVFFVPGSLGQFVALPQETEVEPFLRSSLVPSRGRRGGSPGDDLRRRLSSSGEYPGEDSDDTAQPGPPVAASAWEASEDPLSPTESPVSQTRPRLGFGGSFDAEESPRGRTWEIPRTPPSPGVLRNPHNPRHPVQDEESGPLHSGLTISDHYGISAAFHCEHAFSLSWRSSPGSSGAGGAGAVGGSAGFGDAEDQLAGLQRAQDQESGNRIARAAMRQMRGYRILPMFLALARPLLIFLIFLEALLSVWPPPGPAALLPEWISTPLGLIGDTPGDSGLCDWSLLHAGVAFPSPKVPPLLTEQPFWPDPLRNLFPTPRPHCLDFGDPAASGSAWNWQLTRVLLISVCALLELTRELLIGWWRRLFVWWRLGTFFRDTCGSGADRGEHHSHHLHSLRGGPRHRRRSRLSRSGAPGSSLPASSFPTGARDSGSGGYPAAAAAIIEPSGFGLLGRKVLRLLQWLPVPLCCVCAARRFDQQQRKLRRRARRAVNRWTSRLLVRDLPDHDHADDLRGQPLFQPLAEDVLPAGGAGGVASGSSLRNPQRSSSKLGSPAMAGWGNGGVNRDDDDHEDEDTDDLLLSDSEEDPDGEENHDSHSGSSAVAAGPNGDRLCNLPVVAGLPPAPPPRAGGPTRARGELPSLEGSDSESGSDSDGDDDDDDDGDASGLGPGGEWVMHRRRLREALGVGRMRPLVARDPACPEVSTLHEVFLEAVDRFGHRECAGTRVRLPEREGSSLGPYDFLSYMQVFHRVTWFGDGLVRLAAAVRSTPVAGVGAVLATAPGTAAASVASFSSSHAASMGVGRGPDGTASRTLPGAPPADTLSAASALPGSSTIPVGILSENRVEWLIADLACFGHAGLVSIPLLASSEAELAELLRHSRVEVLVCSRRWTLRVLRAVAKAGSLPLRVIIQMERLQYEELEAAAQLGTDWNPTAGSAAGAAPPSSEGRSAPSPVTLLEFSYVEQKGQRHPISRPRRPLPSDPATVTYHSPSASSSSFAGTPTRGTPSFVGHTLTHGALVAQLSALHMGLNLNEHDVHFSFTPLASLAEHIVLLYALKCGMAIGFYQGSSGGSIFACMELLKPTFLVGSVRIFQELYQRFQRSAKQWTRLYKMFFRVAYSRKQQLFARGQYTSLLWDWLVFRGIARLMGGNLRCILVQFPGPEEASPAHPTGPNSSLVPRTPVAGSPASSALDFPAGLASPTSLDSSDLTDRVFEFLATCFCCPVLHGAVMPEASGFATLGILESGSLRRRQPVPPTTTSPAAAPAYLPGLAPPAASGDDGLHLGAQRIGFGLPCHQLQFLPLGPAPSARRSQATDGASALAQDDCGPNEPSENRGDAGGRAIGAPEDAPASPRGSPRSGPRTKPSWLCRWRLGMRESLRRARQVIWAARSATAIFPPLWPHTTHRPGSPRPRLDQAVVAAGDPGAILARRLAPSVVLSCWRLEQSEAVLPPDCDGDGGCGEERKMPALSAAAPSTTLASSAATGPSGGVPLRLVACRPEDYLVSPSRLRRGHNPLSEQTALSAAESEDQDDGGETEEDEPSWTRVGLLRLRGPSACRRQWNPSGAPAAPAHGSSITQGWAATHLSAAGRATSGLPSTAPAMGVRDWIPTAELCSLGADLSVNRVGRLSDALLLGCLPAPMTADPVVAGAAAEAPENWVLPPFERTLVAALAPLCSPAGHNSWLVSTSGCRRWLRQQHGHSGHEAEAPLSPLAGYSFASAMPGSMPVCAGELPLSSLLHLGRLEALLLRAASASCQERHPLEHSRPRLIGLRLRLLAASPPSGLTQALGARHASTGAPLASAEAVPGESADADLAPGDGRSGDRDDGGVADRWVPWIQPLEAQLIFGGDEGADEWAEDPKGWLAELRALLMSCGLHRFVSLAAVSLNVPGRPRIATERLAQKESDWIGHVAWLCGCEHPSRGAPGLGPN